MNMGKKAVANELLNVADVYIDSCEDEFHLDTYNTSVVLVELAKQQLIQQKRKPKRRRPRA